MKIIIDGNYSLHKSFSVFRNFFYNEHFTGTMYGVLRDVLLLAERFSSKDIHVCWDSRSFRKDLSSEYKNNRVIDKKNNPYDCFEQVKILLSSCGIPQYKEESLEADDLLFSLSRENEPTVLFTKDRDLFQCLTEHTSILRSHKENLYTLETFEAEYGFPFSAKNFVFYKSVVGDGSDNIKGIYRFPKKELVSMLNGKEVSENIQQTLLESHQLLKKNEELFTLKFLDIKKKTSTPDLQKIESIKNQYGIKKLFDTPGAKILGICS